MTGTTAVAPASGRGPRAWWARRSRRARRLILAIPIGLFLLFALLAGIVYAATTIPLPDKVDTANSTVVRFADGSELGRIEKVNRTDVPLRQVPVGVRQAVLAAEDKNYYSEPGISFTGIIRALWVNLTGGSVRQGGSTITQQYAKNAYLTQQRTLSRKLREVVIAIKLDRTYSKDQVLEFYLNTIYFGRGAYGIEAASKAYFGVPVARLTPEQGAVLAGLIRAPSGLDPGRHPEAARGRWHEVLTNMERQHWLPEGRAATAPYPKVLPYRGQSGARIPPPTQFILQEVQRELTDNGIGENELNRGLTITTNLDRKAQQAAVAAVEQVTSGTPADLQEGLVAVEPGTGKVKAWYGGKLYGPTHSYDNVAFAHVPPGSSFKPVALAAALDKGISLDSRYDGRSPQVFPGYPPPGVRNFANNGVDEQFGMIDLTDATAHSVNTVFVPLGLDAGEDKVAATAHALGIRDSTKLNPNSSLPLGVDDQYPIDMARVYAAFAARGESAAPELVAKVTDKSGQTLYTPKPDKRRALPQPVVDDATYAMEQVVQRGTGNPNAVLDGRPAAGKTGTTSNNRSAWFCGYTPQLAAVVALFRDKNQPLQGIGGYGEVTGGTLPALIWKKFMDAALAGQPVLQFPPPAHVGTARNATPSPAPTSASPTPSPTPTPSPSPSETTVPPATAPPVSVPPVSPPPTSSAPLPTTPPPVTPAPAAMGRRRSAH